jgi:acetyl-CoA carboxylase carboxyl transferase subunit alpha
MSTPLRHYLDFERPIADIETKLDELSRLSAEAERKGGAAPSADFESEIAALRTRADRFRRDVYARLDPWQKTQVARHPDRPHFSDYVEALISDYTELRGDRTYGDDQAVVGGLGRFRGQPVVVMGHEKGKDTETRLRHNFGMARPEGYRKAVRLMNLAERFALPVLTFVDTAGAYPGVGAEERGQGEAIARSTERGLTLGTPIIATITGEGGSGGALALAGANKVLILEHSIYSVISPEAGSSILFRDRAQAAHMARAMKITAQDLIGLKIVDRIIAEPPGGAHSDPAATLATVGDAIAEELDALTPLSPDALREQRAERFYAIGRSFG